MQTYEMQSHYNWRGYIWLSKTFATYLKNAGYRTMYAGKYLNQYGRKSEGGVEHIPDGWDWWAGLVGNSK